MAYQYFEYKYLIPLHQLEYVKQLMNSLYINSDPFPSSWVSSTYFDNIERKCFKECLGGDLYKRKFRVRSYEDADTFSVQIKEKCYSAVNKFKDKVGSYSGLWPSQSTLSSQDILGLSSQYGELEPYIKIKYFRHRYRIFNNRVTLDEKINVFSCNGNKKAIFKQYSLPFAVLEIKSNSERPFLPTLGLINLAPMSFSKFFIGLNCLEGKPDALGKY